MKFDGEINFIYFYLYLQLWLLEYFKLQIWQVFL